MKNLILVLSLLLLPGCATLERWVDDIYDGDDRMTEMKYDIDKLRSKLTEARDDLRDKLKLRLNILREEAEMLGDLKKAEFELKLSEMKSQVAVIRDAINEK